MLRTKKDVDRHVQDIFRKLQDKNERTLRCYKIAELYYHVGDYEAARRYLSQYVEVRKEAKAHKLMGRILEALGQKEAALIQFKFSYELDARQEDLILKVCELLADPDMEIDINRAKYWVDRAEKLFPTNKTLFQLKEKILSVERPTNNVEDLEKLIKAELASRPTDVQLRVKLLKHYMENNKLDEAYKHATDIESSSLHKHSLLWYQCLYELFLKCKTNKQSNWAFWISYISALERYAALALKEQGSAVRKTSEAIQAVYNFDQHLFEAKAQSFTNNPSLMDSIFLHMWGQLHLHMACLLLQNTQREQSSWSEAGKLCAPLLLTAMHVKPIDVTASWATHVDSSLKSQLQIWYRNGSYRCSQAGHVLHDYARGNQKNLISNIEKFCAGSWRERIYQRIFIGKIYQKVRSSYFTNNNAMNPPFRLISHNELKRFDEVAEEVWPYSLHHQVWPAVKIRHNIHHHTNRHDSPQPNISSHLFPELQFSVYNLVQASPVTLSRLDIDAFLNAAVLCACAIIEEQQKNKLLSVDRLPTLPADLTSPLCSEEQEKWWTSAYKMYRKEVIDDIGETRQCLQRGLEVVRCIGNHGLHPVILVHLARIFSYRAKQLKEKNNESSDIPALEARSELYWSAAIPLLERLLNNQTIRSTSIKLFEYIGKDMNNMELTLAIEEGKLLLAQKLVRDKLYERAIEALQILKCPEASFEQGKIYKKLADETLSSLPKENVTSEMRSQHIIILSKARNCFYLTLDRLRSPDADPKHPLNAELSTYIVAIENELKRIDPDTVYNERHRNDCDDVSEESYSSAHSDEQPIINNSMPTLNHSLQTPLRLNLRRTPKQSSTPRHQNQDYLDISRNRIEARPSPERLDAQVRQLAHSIESLKEQNREHYRGMISKLDELIKISSRKETSKPRTQPPVVNQNPEDDYYLYEEELNNFNNLSLSTPSTTNPGFDPNLFAPQTAQRHPYSPFIYPPAMAAALQGFYPTGHVPFPDPYGATAAGVYPQIPTLYRGPTAPPPSIIPPMQQMSDSVLQQGLFAKNQSDFAAQQQLLSQPFPQQTAPMHLNEGVKSEPKLGYPTISDPSATEAPLSLTKDNTANITSSTIRKAPPVNVVITTSDTLPTTAPAVQPTLSVTIPAQHRLGVSPTPVNGLGQDAVPHSYQISMPLQPTIPTTVNLPPLSATMTVTSPLVKPYVTENQNSSILSTGSRHSVSSDVTEVEHDPIPDFAPIIPLPDEVPVTTGEENEEELYCARAKLFRFVDKEWKERGIGNVKLLKNTEGKIRLLMRREQILKICANHMIRKDMELSPMPNNDKAYMWVANDFADEELKLEKLCIRFKTSEEASNFKEQFDKARNSLPDESSGFKTASQPETAKPNTGTGKSTKSEAVQNQSVEKIGGFSFASSPIIKNQSTNDAIQKKPEEGVKPSPFASFSFAKSSDSSTPKTFGFNFGSPASTATSTPAFGQDITKISGKHTNVGEVSQLEPGEVVVYELKTSISHLPKDSKTWKDLGTGNIKILSEKSSSRVRLLMNSDDNTKTLYNQIIPEVTVFNLKAETVNWTIISDKSKDSYLARFTNFESANYFTKTIKNELQKAKPASKLANSVTQEKKPLSELFKREAGTWECKDCYSRNKETDKICVCCQAPSPNAVIAPKPTPQSVSRNLFEQFKPAAGSWECSGCYTRNNSDNIKCQCCEAPCPSAPGAASTPALTHSANKSNANSWVCKQCNITNSLSNQYCATCDSPKDPSMPPKPKTTGGFFINSKAPDTKAPFTFGVPQNQTNKEATSLFPPSNTNTNFGLIFNLSSKPSEKAVSSPINIFGTNRTANDSGFNFGMQPPNTPPNNTSGGDPFAFGSPGKSFDFQFHTKSPPIKSPERAETSDDDVVEEAEDVYFAPIIPLPDKVEVKTGEENEDVVYSHRAKLFKYDTTTKEWKERGLGDIKLLRHVESKKLRLVMRREQVLKICLNHAVTADLEITPKDDKTWMWSAGDYSEGEIEYIQFACRFKTSEIAEDFKRAIHDACKDSSFISSTAISSSTSSATTKSTKESSPDVEIVYEINVTSEEKAAALKLKLPENFYAYKYKKDCPGCIGCKEPEVPLFKTQAEVTKPVIIKANTPSTTAHSMFNVFNKPVTTTAAQPSSGLKMTFGTSETPSTGAPLFGDAAKSTGFAFGQSKPIVQDTGLENLKICEPTSKTQQQSSVTATTSASNIFGGFSAGGSLVFGSTTSTTKPGLFSGSGSSSIFSSPAAAVNSTPPATNIFGGSKPTFGNTKTASVFGETKPTITSTATSIFGEPKLSTNMFSCTSSTGAAVATTTPISSTPGTIFSGAKTITGPIFGTTVKPVFGKSATPIFSAPVTTSSTTPIFSGSSTTSSSTFGGNTASSGPIFGGATVTPTFGSSAAQASTPVFGTKTSATTAATATTTSTTSIFGGEVPSQFSSKITFGNTTTATTPASNVFTNSTTQPSINLFGGAAKPIDSTTKENVSFLPTDNSLSFSALAAQTKPEEKPAFKGDPNFTFDGAGASVFGAKTSQKVAQKKTPSKNSPNVKKEKSKDNDGEEDDEENENGDDHDPYFEPIIPLPDTIEVRTGEEDEEKVFCERAKLYRYDNNTKEWKERGVGEFKLLYHSQNGKYRILLRREQVHKVVCNLLLKPDIEFQPLNTSDRAWVWAGMNYADPANPEVEQLAVRFKTPELAGQFKEAIDKAQRILAERQVSGVHIQDYDHNQTEDDNYDDDYNDGDEYGDEDDEEEEDDEDDDEDGHVEMFEKRATVYARNEGELNWSYLAMGNLKVYFDADIYGARIVVENDNKELVSDTIISMDTTMERNEEECTWAAVDYAVNPPVRRTLRSVFSSTQVSQEMYQTFQEGQECATKADIREE